MKFICPECLKVNEAPGLPEYAICTHCNAAFIPDGEWIEPRMPKPGAAMERTGVRGYDEQETIRRNARGIVGLAAVMLIFGVLICVAGIMVGAGSDEAGGGDGCFVAGGAFVSLSLGLYLVGQVVHIRALLASRSGK